MLIYYDGSQVGLVNFSDVSVTTEIASTANARLAFGCIMYPNGTTSNHTSPTLSDIRLYNKVLSGAEISAVTSFQDAYMYGINLSNSKSFYFNFALVDLSNSDLSGSKHSRVEFFRSSLFGANLREADLNNSEFSSVDLRGANLSSTNLNGAQFIDSNLKGANLSNINTNGISFRNCILSNTNFSGAKLDDAHFWNTDLTGANLQVKSMLNININPLNNILCETKLPWGIDNSGCGRVFEWK